MALLFATMPTVNYAHVSGSAPVFSNLAAISPDHGYIGDFELGYAMINTRAAAPSDGDTDVFAPLSMLLTEPVTSIPNLPNSDDDTE
ncbi:MAG TPA: hypothetical protein VME41_13655 [Stellaceae bacterium]|nr:hypothetical protein [Stellaceae bacterium]